MTGLVTCSECGKPESSNFVRSLMPVRDGTGHVVAYERPHVCRRCRMAPNLRGLWDDLRAAEEDVRANPTSYRAVECLRLLRQEWRLANRPRAKDADDQG